MGEEPAQLKLTAREQRANAERLNKSQEHAELCNKLIGLQVVMVPGPDGKAQPQLSIDIQSWANMLIMVKQTAAALSALQEMVLQSGPLARVAHMKPGPTPEDPAEIALDAAPISREQLYLLVAKFLELDMSAIRKALIAGGGQSARDSRIMRPQ